MKQLSLPLASANNNDTHCCLSMIWDEKDLIIQSTRTVDCV